MRNAAAVAEACCNMGNFVIRTNVVQDPFIGPATLSNRASCSLRIKRLGIASTRPQALTWASFCPGIGPVTAPDDAYGLSTQRNGNEPFAPQFFDEGLHALLGLPLPPRVFRD